MAGGKWYRSGQCRFAKTSKDRYHLLPVMVHTYGPRDTLLSSSRQASRGPIYFPTAQPPRIRRHKLAVRAGPGQTRAMTDRIDTPHLRVRIILAPGVWMGPGKADLLDGIKRTGSIAAAGREMGMSYKRAWQLVETMNAMFREPVVARTRGGAKGGGATVTPTGEQVLAAYRTAVEAAHSAGAGQIAELTGMMSDVSGGT